MNILALATVIAKERLSTKLKLNVSPMTRIGLEWRWAGMSLALSKVMFIEII